MTDFCVNVSGSVVPKPRPATVYVPRPLEWVCVVEADHEKWPETWRAETIFGRIDVFRTHWYMAVENALAKPCTSIADGKAAAQAWYEAKLIPALKPVEGER